MKRIEPNATKKKLYSISYDDDWLITIHHHTENNNKSQNFEKKREKTLKTNQSTTKTVELSKRERKSFIYQLRILNSITIRSDQITKPETKMEKSYNSFLHFIHSCNKLTSQMFLPKNLSKCPCRLVIFKWKKNIYDWYAFCGLRWRCMCNIWMAKKDIFFHPPMKQTHTHYMSMFFFLSLLSILEPN